MTSSPSGQGSGSQAGSPGQTDPPATVGVAELPTGETKPAVQATKSGDQRFETGDKGGKAAKTAGKVPLRGAHLDAAVFKQLSAGRTKSQVATSLGIKHQRVSDAARRLVRHGHLRDSAPGAKPAVYGRGPRAEVMDRILASPVSDRGGRSDLPAAMQPGRLHKQDFRWAIDGAPRNRPAVIKSSSPSGVATFTMELRWASRIITVVERQGKKVQSLTFHAGEQWTMDPALLGLESRARMGEIAGLGRWMQQQHGYVLRGELEEVQPPEVAYSEPNMPKFTGVGDLIGVDGSGPEGNELEMRVGPAAQAFARGPAFQAAMESRWEQVMAALGRLEQSLDVVVQAESRTAKLWMKQVGFNQDVVAVQVAQMRSAAPDTNSPAQEPSGGGYA